MKIYILSIALLFGLISCTSSKKQIKPQITTIEQVSNRKALIIDLDEELRLKNPKGDLRGYSGIIIDEPIYIGDNDEVSFKGDIMSKNSPLTIKVGDQDSIIFSGRDYTIKTEELKDRDEIQIKDKDGKVFVLFTIVSY